MKVAEFSAKKWSRESSDAATAMHGFELTNFDPRLCLETGHISHDRSDLGVIHDYTVIPSLGSHFCYSFEARKTGFSSRSWHVP